MLRLMLSLIGDFVRGVVLEVGRFGALGRGMSVLGLIGRL